MNVLIIDHHDSFTRNIEHWLYSGGCVTQVVDHQDLDLMDKAHTWADALLFGPGPKSPEELDESRALMDQVLNVKPLLGVCLGFQMLALALGAGMRPASAPRHGSLRMIYPQCEDPLFNGMARPFAMAAYNSLSICEATMGGRILARCEDGDPQVIANQDGSAIGFQFHPESFLSQEGGVLRGNWLRLVGNSLTKRSAERAPCVPNHT